jgi:predicted RNA-binding Zn-ribbon protein involved in translation (DUF1610 family)
MSKKDLQKQLSDKADEPSTVINMTRQDEDTEPSIFYRCVCPNCGKDSLNLIDSGVFTRSPALGITSDGEIGCAHTELEGGYELGIYCRACGHQVCSDDSFTNECEDEFLSEWVKSNGDARSTLAFACPKCGSQELQQIEIDLEFSTDVVAVCPPDSPGNEPLVAVTHLREIDNRGSFRYRCSRGHELAKDDGRPVQNADELVAWLKARSVVNKG